MNATVYAHPDKETVIRSTIVDGEGWLDINTGPGFRISVRLNRESALRVAESALELSKQLPMIEAKQPEDDVNCPF